jgi:hypothetical protein
VSLLGWMDMKRLPDVYFTFARIPKLESSKFDAKRIYWQQVPDSKQVARPIIALAKMVCCHVCCYVATTKFEIVRLTEGRP